MQSLIAITSSVVRADNYFRSASPLPDRLSPGGVVRSGYEKRSSHVPKAEVWPSVWPQKIFVRNETITM